MKNIKVITKRPGQAPRLTVIENSLEAFQTFVGGYIETYDISTDMTILCNEEGKLDELPENIEVCGEQFVGNIIFVGISDDEFTDIPCTYETFRRLMPDEWWDEVKVDRTCTNENKRQAVAYVEMALKFSRYKDSIKMLELSPNEETVFIHYENRASKAVNIACDSVVAMIKDIADALM